MSKLSLYIYTVYIQLSIQLVLHIPVNLAVNQRTVQITAVLLHMQPNLKMSSLHEQKEILLPIASKFLLINYSQKEQNISQKQHKDSETHSIFNSSEAMAHPPSCGTITANVRKQFLIMWIRSAKRHFLYDLINHK